jgi:hopanoid biosynthesis associated protein HpnK
MLKLLVHADDFGLSEQINTGILQAHLHGILTSTSLMANGAAFDHAMSICQSVSTLDVGIHLTLVEEQPILDTESVPSLVNEEGRFHRHATTFTKKYFMGKICLREVRNELEAQIRKVINRGVSVSHLDSHQHLHMLPQILRITVELARQYGIPAIRLPRERVRSYMLPGKGTIARFLQLVGLNLFCYLGRHADVRRTDHFVGFFYGGNLHKQHLHTVLQHLPHTGTCELMCHPGFDDPNTRYGHWQYHWSDELNALLDPAIASFLKSQGIRLISYHQLTNL